VIGERIFGYPGHWGLFGGTVEAGEDTKAALQRELVEELHYTPKILSHFLDATFSFSFVTGELTRSVYEVVMESSVLEQLDLGEGADMRVFTPETIRSRVRIVPCDRFVLDLHIRQRTAKSSG